MKKLLTLVVLLMTTISFGQTITFSQWDFDTSTTTPTTGNGTISTIGGTTENPYTQGNPSTGKAYTITNFPATLIGSGTAGYEIVVNTSTATEQVSLSFDIKGSATSSKNLQCQYTTDGSNWISLGNNIVTTNFTKIIIPIPTNQTKIRILSIFEPNGTDYTAIGSTSTYGSGGTWRIDNLIVYTGTLSTNQNQILGLQVYPNPTKNILNISTNSNLAKIVQVYDMIGKEVINTQIENQLNVSNLTTGMYVAKITEDGKTSTTKIVIQ